MDSTTIKKYFNLGDEVEISSPNVVSVGKIVDFSDSVLVIEDGMGNPVILSLEIIISCKKTSEAIAPSSNSKDLESDNVDYTNNIISNIIESLDNIYSDCEIPKESIIPTNAVVTGMTPEGVEVKMDDGTIAVCVKSSFVGYSRENAAVGKKVFCSPGNNNVSYASLTEMSYGEMYDRFLRAIKTSPKPRTTICGSVLFLLTKVYGNKILPQKKAIKQLIRKINYSPAVSTRIKLADLTTEQKSQIIELIQKHSGELVTLSEQEKTKFADNLIGEKLGFKLRRVGIKTILSEIANEQLKDTNKDLIEGSSKIEEEHNVEPSNDPYVSATCEIIKYYPQFHNGMAADKDNEQIRYKEDVIVDSDLISNLNTCWKTPIPVICVYKSGKKTNAVFITKPGYLSEIRTRIRKLRLEGKNELADAVDNYIEELGFYNQTEPNINLSTSSEELLKFSRRQRLIKNFAVAEKGFLELISRNFEFDAVVRDLAAMYQEWQNAQKAIVLLENNLPKLEEKVKTYNLLSLLYQSIGDKKNAVAVMEKALDLIPPSNKANEKKILKLKKRINNLKKNLKVPNSEVEIQELSKLFSKEDIPSALIRYDANNSTNNVLTYVKDKTIEEKLSFVNQRIGELKNSVDLPSYYLAKIQLLEDSGESATSTQVRSLLADYCKAKARNFFNEGNVISAREYLLQGISISEKEELYYLLFLSLCSSAQNVLSLYNTNISGYEDISSSYQLIEDDDTLYVLFRILSVDNILSRKLLRIIYESDALSWLCDELDVDSLEPKEYIELMTKTSKLHEHDILNYESAIDKLLLSNSVIELSRSLINMPSLTSKEVSSFDCTVLVEVEEVANLIIDFDKNLSYDESEEIYRNAMNKIDMVVSQIHLTPTRVSTLHLMPILLKSRDLLERTFNNRYTESLPHIIIEAIDDARPIGDEIEIQISILNEEGFSKASNCTFKIGSINGRDVTSLSLINTLETPLFGGSKVSTAFNLKSTLFSSENIEIEYQFDYYDVRKVKRSKNGKIIFAINKGYDYVDFDNPFIAHIRSNAVKDKAMFKGRDEIIDTICKYVLEDYKGYVLFGQKRSGKSSVLYHITQRLRDERKAFAVDYTMGNSIVEGIESENDSMANLFYTIISEIGRAIKDVNREVYKECGCHIVRRQEFEAYPDKTFREYLDFYRDIILDKLHYEQDKIVLIIDEFTYLYYHILEGKISPRIMEFWKGLVESRVFSFVFAGQDAMPRFMEDFPNIFESMHPEELTYIDEISARELIEKPIWDTENNCSRFDKDAVDKIIELTACSPFYIMILCSELVKFARQRRRLPIHVGDVEALVQRMICNDSSISRKDFDNLISCGESRLDLIDKDDSLKVLKDLAVKSRNVEYYDINAITVFEKDKVKSIVDDLLRRKVLAPNLSNKVKIKVGLFKLWLLNHE